MKKRKNEISMHNNEFPITADLVKCLIDSQFPEYSALPITQVTSSGTDNALYRLGDNLCIRLPRIPQATQYCKKNARFLLQIADQLPLHIPIPIAQGQPNDHYPWHWTIYPWIKGKTVFTNHTFDDHQAALDLALFLKSLQNIDLPNVTPSPRSIPLISRDKEVRNALTLLQNDINTDAAQLLWEKCIKAPSWRKKPVLIHGDLLPTNILIFNNRINAIIDFDFFGTGDPACDLLPAWCIFPSKAREVFRKALNVDDATWLRGQGWALSIALIIIPYYKNSNPILTSIAYRMINELLKNM